jgi:ABC-type glycerol-3-phosphate transport system permease component
MQYVDSTASTVAKWMKDVPHLPKGFTKWLAENSWWLTIIGVVLSVFAVLSLLVAMTAGSAVLVAVGAASLGGMFFISSLVTLVGTGVAVIVEAMAIAPLKEMKKRGWDLMFFALLVSVALGIVGSLLNINIVGILFGLIGAAIGAYVALELKPYFVK